MTASRCVGRSKSPPRSRDVKTRLDPRVPLILIGCIVLAAVGAYVTAAPSSPEWFVYIHDQDQLLRLYIDGRTEPVDMPPSADTYRSSYYAPYSPNGRFRAVCEYDADFQGHIFYIYDLVEQEFTVALNFGKIAHCGNAIFSSDEHYSAVGILNYAPPMENIKFICDLPDLPTYPEECVIDRIKPAWQIFLIDLDKKQIVHEMNAEATYFTDLAKDEQKFSNDYFMPEMLSVSADEITFAGVVWRPIDAVLRFGAWRWNAHSGEVRDAASVLSENWQDTLTATGEEIYLETDYCLQAGFHSEGSGYDISPNIMRVITEYNKNTIVYFDGVVGIRSARFINDGRQIAIQLFGNITSETPNLEATYRWVILDRNGMTQSFTKFIEETTDPLEVLFDPINIMPAPNGYMVMEHNLESQHDKLIYHTEGEQRILWQGEDWGLAWYPQARGTSNYLPPFTEIEPVLDLDIIWVDSWVVKNCPELKIYLETD